MGRGVDDTRTPLNGRMSRSMNGRMSRRSPRPSTAPTLTAPTRAATLAALAPPVVVLGVFFAWPLVAIARRGLAWSALTRVFGEPVIWRVAWFTCWQAAASTALTLAAAAPITYALSRFSFRGRHAVLALVGVPFVLPTVVVAVAFQATLPARWQQSVTAILLAHVFFNVAVVVRTVVPAWQQLDVRYEDAGRTLGASRWRATRTIAVPLLRGPVLAAAAIVFLFSFTSFGVIKLLGGPRHTTLEVEIYRRAVQQVDLGAACALGLVQLLAVVAVLQLWARAERRRPPAAAIGASRVPRASRRGERCFVVAVVGLTLALLALPMGRLIGRSLTVGGHGYSTLWYRTLSSSGAGTTRAVRPLSAFRTSFTISLWATLVAVVVGGCAAVALSSLRRRAGDGRSRAARVADVGLMLPLGTSAVTIGLGLFVAFAGPPVDLRGSAVMIPLAHALVGIPFVVRAVAPTLASIDPRLRDAAATLGSSRWRTFRTIDLPLARRTLVAGAGMAFAVSLGEFGATSFLARRSGRTVPLVIADLLGRPGASSVGQAEALAVLLAVASGASFVVADSLSRRGRTRRLARRWPRRVPARAGTERSCPPRETAP